MSNSFKALGKTIASSLGIFALIKLGKQAIETASSLQEIQNVVDQSFGDASAEINDFADKAMMAFGLTELQAKKTASTLMAMSNGMNINTQAGKIMAVNLTKLSGDMASFYNVSQDVAETALESVFTGETESLKKFGIVMTDANLQAFAYTKGINKQISAMTQAEKVALRYKYVMESTSKAQGDFARTSGNWANQVRVLVGQFNQLKSILGSGLISVLTPILSILNQILASLIAIANSFSKIFGGSGIAKASSTIAGASANVGGMADNFEDANSKAKKLKKTIAGFDELEVLNGNNSSGADIGAGAGSDMMVQDYYGDIVDGEEQSKSFNDIIKSFNDNINKYFDQIVAFGGELANKFNTAFKSIDWVLLGETIANGLNLVYNTANNFLETADWLGLGQSFATGLNSIFTNLDWEAIGQNIANRLNAIGNIIYGFVDTLDWVGLGEGLKTRFLTAINGIDWALLGSAFGKGLTGIFTTLNTFLEGGTIENLGFKISEAINNALMNIDATAMGQGIHNLTSQLIIAFENIDWKLLGTKIREFLQSVDLIGIIKDWFSAITDNIASVVAGAFNIPEGTADVIVDLAFVFAGLAKVLGGVLPLLTGFIEVGANLKILGVNIPILSSLSGWLGSLGGLFKTTTGEVGLFKGVFDGVKTLLSEAGTGFTNIGLKITDFFTVANNGSAGAQALSKQLGLISQNGSTLQLVSAKLNIGLSNLWGIMKAHPIGLIVSAIALAVASVVSLYNKSEEFRKFVSKTWDILKDIFGEIGNSLKDLWDNHILPLWEELQPLLQSIGDAFSELWDAISTVIGWIVGAIGGSLLTGIASAFKEIVEIITKAIASITDIIRGIIQVIDGIIHFDLQKIIDGITNILQGLLSFIVNTFKTSWRVAWEGIIGVFRGLFQLLPDFIKKPINSVIGFINGMLKAVVDGVNYVIRKINTLSWKVPDWVPGIGGQRWGFNFKTFTAYQIPLLANGGVIEQPTVAMMGEYAGASNNPEIATPQSLLQQIIDNSNNNVVDALIQQTKQLLQALENVDMSVSIGDDVIARSAQRGNVAYRRMTGKPLFV